MEKEIKSVIGKTVKIAGVTCIALGGAALIASGAALKAITEGGKYLKETIQKIVDEEPKTEKPADEAVAREHDEVPVAEAAAEEMDFAGAEFQDT